MTTAVIPTTCPTTPPTEPATFGETCPCCDTPLPGLLAACRKPACLRADLDAEAAIDQSAER